MLLLVFILLWNLVYSSEMNYIPKDWVDPTDMRYYDRYNKKMKCPSSSGRESDSCIDVAINENDTNNARDLRRFEIFLERFVNHLLSTANLRDKVLTPRTRITTEIPVMITSEELSRLSELSHNINSDKLTELDELFSSILTNERGFSFDSLTPYLNPIQLLFYNLSYEKITVLIFFMMVCVVMWMFAVGRELKKIIIFLYLIFFMGGLGWNWWKMYQEAVIEQFSEMKRLSQIPDVCVPKRSGFFSYILSSTSEKEDCRKYHEAFQFNPFSKVPPSIVLSETVSGMMIHPLKALGSSIGQFLIGINSAASWPLNILFLPFIFLVSVASLLCLVIVCLGVKLNFWTLLGGVSIGGRVRNEPVNHLSITDEISLRRAVQYESDNIYVLAQVSTIKKCITCVRDNEPMTVPLKNEHPTKSVMNHYFRFPGAPKDDESHKEELNFGSGDGEGHYDPSEFENWNQALRLVNCNAKRKLPSMKAVNMRSVFLRKRQK